MSLEAAFIRIGSQAPARLRDRIRIAIDSGHGRSSREQSLTVAAAAESAVEDSRRAREVVEDLGNEDRGMVVGGVIACGFSVLRGDHWRRVVWFKLVARAGH